MRVADVLVQMKTSRFEPIYSYAVPDGDDVAIGDVVRVGLGKRAQVGFVVGEPRVVEADRVYKPLARIPEIERAFEPDSLALARMVAEYYCCSLGEALATVVPANAVPRMVERLVPGDRALAEGRAPERLVRLLWDDFAEGVGVEEFLRHPEARRSGDREMLRGVVRTLVEHGALRRVRTEASAAIAARSVRMLRPGTTVPRGKRAAALRALVESRGGTLASSEAVLAGFPRARITAAVRAGAVEEYETQAQPPQRRRVLSPAAFVATSEQAEAIATLRALDTRREFAEVLVHGVTGSGKTFVYLEFIRSLVERGESAIVLVPEISLTPQTARRFVDSFGDDVVVLHSGLSERERFEGRRAAERGEVRVVVGARSAVFTPLPNLRAIIVDEAHESSYKQDSTPRYHALTIARERLRAIGGVLVAGSATPPLEEYARARLGRSTLLTLRSRATALPMPTTTIVDLGREDAPGERTVLSARLVGALERCLSHGEKAVLFVNRRGTASFVLCRVCGYVPKCTRCSLSLTYHRGESLLRCHLCDAQAPMRDTCAQCGTAPMKAFGIGTERVASELLERFPAARVVRMDSDTTTRIGDHARLLGEFEREGDVLVGTQMIAKGLDFPTVTLAAVVAADMSLHVADFRASERTFDLLTQVAGRSGRARAGEAIIQTYLSGHPAIRFAAEHDYDGFAKAELAERRELRYPPFCRLTYLGIIGRDREAATAAAREVVEALEREHVGEVLGPSFYPVARVNHEWRLRVAVKSQQLEPVRAAVRDVVVPLMHRRRGLRLALNIDP